MICASPIHPTDSPIYATRLYLEALHTLGTSESEALRSARRIVCSAADDKSTVAALTQDLTQRLQKQEVRGL